MRMTRIPGLAAIGAVFVLTAPAEPARALSLANPAAAAATQEDLHQGATQVHWHHGWHPGGIMAGTTVTGERVNSNRPASRGPVFYPTIISCHDPRNALINCI